MKLMKKIKERCLTIHFNERILDYSNVNFDTKSITTNTGKVIDADLFFNCTGNHGEIDSMIVEGLGSVTCKEGIKVNQFFQVEGFKNIFSCGDALNADDGKFAYLAESQAVLVARNICSVICANRSDSNVKLNAYSKTTSMMIVVPYILL